jgi:FkbM family methyltransferase
MIEAETIQMFSLDIQTKLERIQNDIDFIKNHMSSYLGNGTGLTHLVDETPIYINTNDFGCPSNFINGGRYEEDHYHMLASFRNPDSVFLDIGANLGVFSLRMAPLIRKGKIFAFEPNSIIHELFSRSIHLNGLSHNIVLFGYGASDKDAELILSVPDGHAGGASVVAVESGSKGNKIQVRRLDDLLSNLDQFHIAKIDVEGHELNVLLGMEALLRRSTDAVIIFEKLNRNSGIERDLFNFFHKLGIALYKIVGMQLAQINLDQFIESEAYFFAARPETIGKQFLRNFLTIYPDDLYMITGSVIDGHLTINQSVSHGALLFHGPYWYLQRGSYNMTIDAEISGEVSVILTEKFGYHVKGFVASAESNSFNFNVDRDLTKFEIAFRAISEQINISMKNIRLTRLG